MKLKYIAPLVLLTGLGTAALGITNHPVINRVAAPMAPVESGTVSPTNSTTPIPSETTESTPTVSNPQTSPQVQTPKVEPVATAQPQTSTTPSVLHTVNNDLPDGTCIAEPGTGMGCAINTSAGHTPIGQDLGRQ